MCFFVGFFRPNQKRWGTQKMLQFLYHEKTPKQQIQHVYRGLTTLWFYGFWCSKTLLIEWEKTWKFVAPNRFPWSGPWNVNGFHDTKPPKFNSSTSKNNHLVKRKRFVFQPSWFSGVMCNCSGCFLQISYIISFILNRKVPIFPKTKKTSWFLGSCLFFPAAPSIPCPPKKCVREACEKHRLLVWCES